MTRLGRRLLLLVLIASPPAVFAHRLDEYLQATLVLIQPGEIRLDINLSPGVEVADRVLAVIDRSGDGAISTNEAAGYGELLKQDLTLRLDGRELGLKLAGLNMAAPEELRSGWGTMQMQFSAPIGRLAAGAHRLTLENRHLTNMSVYLFNAALPKSAEIHVTRQSRNDNQSTGEIEFAFDRKAGALSSATVIAIVAALLVAVVAGAKRAGANRRQNGTSQICRVRAHLI